jgi:hypothetical protein
MTFITHEFRVSMVSDVRERVRDLVSPLRFMLRRSSLVECVSVLHGTCLQCAEKKYIHQYVKPCEENPRYTFLTIKSSLRSHIKKIYIHVCINLFHIRIRLIKLRHVQQYISFIGGGNSSTRRKPQTCCKSLTNLMLYRVHFAINGIQSHNISGDGHWMTDCIAIGSYGHWMTDCIAIGSYKSNYHTITTNLCINW